MSSKHKITVDPWIGGVIGLFVGISGNLIASWIQQDLFSNSFTVVRITVIVLCAVIGTLITAWLTQKKNMTIPKSEINGKTSKNTYSKIKLAWSKLRTRGKDIRMEDVSALGSDVDIDTK